MHHRTMSTPSLKQRLTCTLSSKDKNLELLRRKPLEKLYYAMGGWIAFNVMLVIVLLNRRHFPHVRHRFARWAMSAPCAPRRRHSAHALVTAATCRH